MKKLSFFKKKENIDDVNINVENVDLKEKDDRIFIEKNGFNIGIIVVMAFLLVFGNFSTANENIASISEILSFAIGMADIIGEAFYKKKNDYTLYNKVIIILSSLIFFLIGERISAIVILMVYLVCRFLVRIFKKKQNKVFENLKDILPEHARVYVEGVETILPATAIKEGNVVKVQAGELIPSDGTVFQGKATIDETILSEAGSTTRNVSEDDKVWAGCKVLTGRLQVVMDVAYQESYIAQSIESVNKVMNEEEKISPRYLKITNIYLMVMWIAVLVVMAVGIFTDNFQYWILRSNLLMLSTTLGSMQGIWRTTINYYILNAFEKGVIFKEKSVVEKLENMDLVIIDDDITTGIKEFSLSHIHNIDCTKQEIMTYAGYLEYYSKHPIGRVIYNGFLQVAKCEGLEEGDVLRPDLISDFNELEGKGVSGYLGDMFLCVGNKKMMQLINLRDLPAEEEKEIIYVAVNQKLLGYIALNVSYKDQDNQFYTEWGKVNIEKVAMYNSKEDEFSKLLGEMEQEKSKKSTIGAVTRQVEKIKEMTGGDFTILLDARCKNKVGGDLHIPGRNLVEISELKLDLASAMSMARLKCKGFEAAKIACYGAAVFGIIPVWVPFVVEMLAISLISMTGELKNASTDGEVR